MMSSKAPLTCTAFSCLFLKSSLSYYLASTMATALLFNMSSWIPLFLISPSKAAISPSNTVISASALAFLPVASSILLLNSAISSVH